MSPLRFDQPTFGRRRTSPLGDGAKPRASATIPPSPPNKELRHLLMALTFNVKRYIVSQSLRAFVARTLAACLRLARPAVGAGLAEWLNANWPCCMPPESCGICCHRRVTGWRRLKETVWDSTASASMTNGESVSVGQVSGRRMWKLWIITKEARP